MLRDDTSAAYRDGIVEAYAGGPARLAHVLEARKAVDSWTRAQSDHAETSYYGSAHVRAMRAYWLGRLRASRWQAIASGARPDTIARARQLT